MRTDKDLNIYNIKEIIKEIEAINIASIWSILNYEKKNTKIKKENKKKIMII